MARAAQSQEHYQKVTNLEWNENELRVGKTIRLKGMPGDFLMKPFRVPVSNNRLDHVVTNDTSQSCADDTRKVCAMRWLIEQFHRELKQISGLEFCRCRKQRIQRNHITYAALVWVRLKQLAYKTGETVYQMKRGLLGNYLTEKLKNTTFSMGFA